MNILYDSREKAPFLFDNPIYTPSTVTRAKLNIGDYSLKQFENTIAIERKSLSDLIICLGRERNRFLNELLNARGLKRFAIVCEGSLQDIAQHNYRGKLHPHAALQSIAMFQGRLGIQIIFAGSRPLAEYMTFSIMDQFLKGKLHELDAINDLLDDYRKSIKQRGKDNAIPLETPR